MTPAQSARLAAMADAAAFAHAGQPAGPERDAAVLAGLGRVTAAAIASGTPREVAEALSTMIADAAMARLAELDVAGAGVLGNA